MTATRRRLTEYAETCEIELIFYEPPEVFDAAIVGLVGGFGQEPAVCYDEARVLEGFARDGMTWEDAREWVDVNCLGQFVGPATPRFLVRTQDLP
jgi:hypothetical protein